MSKTNRDYYAVIGEQTMHLQAPNVWVAAERAAVHFRSRLLEGLEFFRGNADMAIWRPGMDAPVYSGTVGKWMDTFKKQGRNMRRWERLVEPAAPTARVLMIEALFGR